MQINNPINRFIPASVLFLIFVFLISCKKPDIPSSVPETTLSQAIQNGLPSDYKSINGYLYASFNGNALSCFAIFGDPGRNLMLNYDHFVNITSIKTSSADPDRGNVSVGNVSFSGQLVFQGVSSNSWSYFNDNFFTGLPTTNWKYDGNKSFKAQDIFIPRGFPVLFDSVIKNSDTIKINKGFTINHKGAYRNYDSLVVIISSTNPTFLQKRKVFISGEPVSFSPADLNFLLSRNSVFISVKAYNYSNQIIEGKKIVFELASTTVNGKVLLVVP